MPISSSVASTSKNQTLMNGDVGHITSRDNGDSRSENLLNGDIYPSSRGRNATELSGTIICSPPMSNCMQQQ